MHTFLSDLWTCIYKFYSFISLQIRVTCLFTKKDIYIYFTYISLIYTHTCWSVCKIAFNLFFRNVGKHLAMISNQMFIPTNWPLYCYWIVDDSRWGLQIEVSIMLLLDISCTTGNIYERHVYEAKIKKNC